MLFLVYLDVHQLTPLLLYSRGLNLKAGQGVFGRADPYVKLRLGDNEVSTNPHKNGGKNPVRFVSQGLV